MKHRIFTTEELVRRLIVASRIYFEPAVIADQVLQQVFGPKRLCAGVRAHPESTAGRVRQFQVQVRACTAHLRAHQAEIFHKS